MVETPIEKDDILRVLKWKARKFEVHKRELAAAGVIYKQRFGAPPIKKWMAFESDLRAWIRAKAARGELL